MSWHSEARFHALGSRPSAGMARGYFNHGLCSHCVLCLREEPGNPKPWTNLVTPHSYRSHGPSEFSVLLSLSVVPPDPGSGVSDRGCRVNRQGMGRGAIWDLSFLLRAW